ncbi:hypothetical protein J2853_006256 [Streptosporangium lutulentum]|uniref:Uncharacterized protein n=1 Tax=Streptosporangium lutulentum TaxID=1461250 RepID=A0ABT9QJW6_9ACTN|nr:hypothetical protein [Streptosporangium lutulentum]
MLGTTTDTVDRPTGPDGPPRPLADRPRQACDLETR